MLQARNAAGDTLGWGRRQGDSHPLVTAWAVMALKSAKVAGLRVEPAAYDGAIRYFDQITGENGAVARQALDEMRRRFPNQADIWGAGEAELLQLLVKQENEAGRSNAELARQIRQYLVKDLVVVMSWDTNGTDIDLHVTEPCGEECFYSHRTTASGGALDHDNTTGLGPETYALRRAKPGKYKIDVDYFGGTPVTIATVRIYRNRNGDNETLATKTVELAKAKDRVTVDIVDMPDAPVRK